MKAYLSLIKFAHTVFALPFAVASFFIASTRYPQGISWHTLLLIIACMVFARSAAMAFNRYADRDIDHLNARTRIREIPSGVIRPASALWFTIIMSLAFVVTTWYINPLCFYLSPVALAVILGYSLTKRITWWCHIVLGIALGLAPVGAYLAVTGSFDLLPVLYGIMVMCWVSGFDILYALQDESFDREQGLHSIPGRFGKETAKRISLALHTMCGVLLMLIGVWQVKLFPAFGWIYWIGAAGFILLLFRQHYLVLRYDLQRINQAFFETNGVASVLLGLTIIADVFL